MPCSGYDHNSSVKLIAHLKDMSIPIGTCGLVVRIDEDKHKIDVEFVEYGRLNGLDAHSFKLQGGADRPVQLTG